MNRPWSSIDGPSIASRILGLPRPAPEFPNRERNSRTPARSSTAPCYAARVCAYIRRRQGLRAPARQDCAHLSDRLRQCTRQCAEGVQASRRGPFALRQLQRSAAKAVRDHAHHLIDRAVQLAGQHVALPDASDQRVIDSLPTDTTRSSCGRCRPAGAARMRRPRYRRTVPDAEVSRFAVREISAWRRLLTSIPCVMGSMSNSSPNALSSHAFSRPSRPDRVLTGVGMIGAKHEQQGSSRRPHHCTGG